MCLESGRVSTSDDLPWVLAALLASLNCSEQARIAYTFQVEVPRELLRESSNLKARGEWYHALPNFCDEDGIILSC